jgi:hypothetical protein
VTARTADALLDLLADIAPTAPCAQKQRLPEDDASEIAAAHSGGSGI